MSVIEKYYGVDGTRKLTDKRLKSRSSKYIAKLEEEQLLKRTNELFVKGNTLACFDLLHNAVRLVPNDFRPYYLLGLIHEENQCYDKSMLAYIAAASLRRTDTQLWRKALQVALKTKSKHNQILVLDRVSHREPSAEILNQKLSILKEMKKKSAAIACQIELFAYNGVDQNIFDRIKATASRNALRRICLSLCKCIKDNEEARNELFLRKTIHCLYRIKYWKHIMKILDTYYIRKNYSMTPDIRFIYVIADSYHNDCRMDVLLLVENLVKENSVWAELDDIEYAYDLCQALKSAGRLADAIVVARRVLEVSKTIRVLHLLGNLHNRSGSIEEAVCYFNEVLSIDPVDMEAKVKLHGLYEQLGYGRLADEFAASTRISEYFKETFDAKKSEFRYSATMCKDIREAYTKAQNATGSDYIDVAMPLLDDFFSNPFVVIRNKNFKSFASKNEKHCVSDAQGLVQYDNNWSKKQLFESLIRISSLHGLDVDEWFELAKGMIVFLIYENRDDDAIELVEKCIQIHLFRVGSYHIQLAFLALRLYLLYEDFDGIVRIVRQMIKVHGYTSIYLLYFLAHFIPDFGFNREFAALQKNIQRKIRRGTRSHDEDDEVSGDSLDSDLPGTFPVFMGICGFIPRFLQTETVDFVHLNIKSEREDVSTLKGIISIAHTKSRTLVDKKKYATQGIDCLKELPETHMKLYNLAKAYHFFGFYPHAEKYYLQVIETGPVELRRMSIFNLSLIYKNNKSRKVMENLLMKFA